MNSSDLDPSILHPSGALLGAHTAVATAIERNAVDALAQDPTTLDLLLRLALSPEKQLRGVELGRQLQLNAGYVSRRIDRAEGAGLVERTPDPADRRAQLIRLTTAGQDVIADFAPLLNQVLQAVIFDALSASEIAVFVDLLGRVETAARELVAEAETAG